MLPCYVVFESPSLAGQNGINTHPITATEPRREPRKPLRRANGTGGIRSKWPGSHVFQAKLGAGRWHTRSATSDGDEAGLLVIQFPDFGSATSFTTSGNYWPVGSETVAIGSHQATVSRDFNESANLAFAKIGWICGVHSNLVVLGFYDIATTDPAGSTAARDKLVTLATSVHDGFVSIGVCANGKPANTTPPLDSTLESLFGTFDVDVVTFIQQNTDPDMQAAAAARARQLGADMEASLLSQATDVGGLANVPGARDAFKRLVYLASLVDKDTGKPLFPTLVHPSVKALIDRMAVLSARDGAAVEPTNRLLTILAVADMADLAEGSGQ